jgi:hypothetical protein
MSSKLPREKEESRKSRFKYFDLMTRIYIGPLEEYDFEIPRDSEFFAIDSERIRVPISPGIPDLPISDKVRIPRNSINGYRRVLAEANSTGSRTLQSKMKPFAESAVRFIQYVTTQRDYMENLTPEGAKMLINYSNPSILNSPIRQRVLPPKDQIADQVKK